MASKISVSKTHLFELESGKSRNPTLDIIKKLANGYEVSVELLVGESISHGDKNIHDKNW